MSSKAAIHISIRAGDPRPSVFSTALSKAESRELNAWLRMHPELDRLQITALELAEAEDPTEGETYRLWVDKERTTLVRFWESGAVEVATRPNSGSTWGPPVRLVEEALDE